MRFFGLGFFMESSPPWALIVTLKRFYVFYLPRGFIQKKVISAQWFTALTPCLRSDSLQGHHVRAVIHCADTKKENVPKFSALIHCADTVSAQWFTAGTWCPRSDSLRQHGVSTVIHCADIVSAANSSRNARFELWLKGTVLKNFQIFLFTSKTS